jgi:hypothetical protein
LPVQKENNDFEIEMQRISASAQDYDKQQSIDDGEEQPEQEEAPQIETADLLLALLGPLCAVACPNWNLKKTELEALSMSYAELIDKYFPDGLHKDFGCEITALLVTVTVFGSRAGVPRTKAEEKEINPKTDHAKN